MRGREGKRKIERRERKKSINKERLKITRSPGVGPGAQERQSYMLPLHYDRFILISLISFSSLLFLFLSFIYPSFYSYSHSPLLSSIVMPFFPSPYFLPFLPLLFFFYFLSPFFLTFHFCFPLDRKTLSICFDFFLSFSSSNRFCLYHIISLDG